MSAATMAVYRRVLFGEQDPLYDRCLRVTATVAAVWALVALVVPITKPAPVTVAELPTRIAKLIIEKPKPVPQSIVEAARPPGEVLNLETDGDGTGGGPRDRAPGAPGEPGPAVNAPAVPGVPELPPGPAPGPPLEVRRPGLGPGPAVGVASGAGRAGRELAQSTVAAELSGTSQALSSALGGLSTSLARGAGSGPAPGDGDGSGGGGSPVGGRDRGVRGPRAARAASGLGGPGMGGSGTGGGGGGVGGGGVGGGGADLGGSAIAGSRVAVGAVSGYGGGGAGGAYGTGGGGGGGGGTGGGGQGGEGGGDGTGGSGAAPGVYRSNASLLAVINKYAAGIHYCYTNELKKDPSLRGKLVFALTVAANGDVTEATVVENSLRSAKLTSCALSQVREWKFPPVARGVTTFQVPFVFTPPE